MLRFPPTAGSESKLPIIELKLPPVEDCHANLGDGFGVEHVVGSPAKAPMCSSPPPSKTSHIPRTTFIARMSYAIVSSGQNILVF